MATLPRSVSSFRRQGSSGLVWDDALQKEVARTEFRELRLSRSANATPLGLVYGNSHVELTICTRSNSTPAKKPKSFKAKFLKMFPAVFGKWATRKFNRGKEMAQFACIQSVMCDFMLLSFIFSHWYLFMYKQSQIVQLKSVIMFCSLLQIEKSHLLNSCNYCFCVC